MTNNFSTIRESLTQARDLLSAAMASSTELPVDLLANGVLQNKMVDAYATLVKAVSSESSAIEFTPATVAVREILAALQDTALPEVVDSVVTRRIATALVLLHELKKIHKEEDAPPPPVSLLPSRTADVHDSTTSLNVDMHEEMAHSFFTDLAGELDAGGLFVASYDLKPVGQSVGLRVRLAPKTILNLNGTVVWVREYNHAVPDMRPGMGISLHNVGSREHSAIKQHIRLRDVLYFEAS